MKKLKPPFSAWPDAAAREAYTTTIVNGVPGSAALVIPSSAASNCTAGRPFTTAPRYTGRLEATPCVAWLPAPERSGHVTTGAPSARPVRASDCSHSTSPGRDAGSSNGPGSGGASTGTDFVTDALSPSSSVTVRVTSYVAAVAKS